MDSRQNGVWIKYTKPSNLHIGQAINKITTVVEAKQDNGYDIFINGKHHYYQDPTNSLKTVRTIRYSSSTPSLQFSIGKVITKELQILPIDMDIN